MNRALPLALGLALFGCDFAPRPPSLGALGETCAADAECASAVCDTTCVECSTSAPCAGGDICRDGSCVPPDVEVAVPAVIGGPVQTDTRGFKHRGRVAVPAVTTHRSTARGP